jgi:hypothetical protein
MSSVGTILRDERVRQGRELGPIADSLCITKRYLDAIERDDLKSLPGVFFYRSFVKQYAEILGLPESVLAAPMEILLAVDEPLPLPGNDPVYTLNLTPVKTRDPRAGDAILTESNERMLRDRRIAIPAVALIVALVGGGFVYERWSQAGKTAETASIPTVAVQTRSAVVTSPVSAPIETAFSGTTIHPGDDVQINVEATENVWISITSDGKQIFSGVLKPTESKSLSGREFAKVSVGNAAGLEIRWNGKQIGPIGKRGQVRTLKFTKDNFEILPPMGVVGQTL